MEQEVYLAPGTYVVGDVRLGKQVSIWYGAVLRGDWGTITIGDRSNVQDNAVLHDDATVGHDCSIGHSAIVHGCTVGDYCTVGMGSVVLNGAVVGPNCMIGAGAIVTGTMRAPAGSLLLGNPARVIRPLTEEEIQKLHKNADDYVALAQRSLPLGKAGRPLDE